MDIARIKLSGKEHIAISFAISTSPHALREERISFPESGCQANLVPETWPCLPRYRESAKPDALGVIPAPKFTRKRFKERGEDGACVAYHGGAMPLGALRRGIAESGGGDSGRTLSTWGEWRRTGLCSIHLLPRRMDRSFHPFNHVFIHPSELSVLAK